MERSVLCLVLCCCLFVVICEAKVRHVKIGNNWPANVTLLIQSYGYPCQDYVTQTEDGYILSLQRIPHGKNNNTAIKGIVYFQHGLTDNSNGISLNPPPEGLPFYLADAGYEVWLGNNRGNGYSMANFHYTPNQPQFWQFTYDDMAAYDLPTQINFILNTTKAKTLTYIGHSEGTTQAFAGFIENPALAEKVNIFIALAPVCYMYNQQSQILEVMSYIDAATLSYLLGDLEFHLSAAAHRLLPEICSETPWICDDTLDLLMGTSTNINETELSFYMNYEPNPTSTLNLIHWSQGVTDEVFQKYDYGTAGNMQHYNQSTPPQYDLSKFPKSLPVALFSGGNDFLADPTDVATLIKQLPVAPVYQNVQPTYSHIDFLWADDAHLVIYPDVLKLIQKYNK